MDTVTHNGITGTESCVDALPEFFQYVEIEISTACNLRCRYCPNSISDRGLVKNNRQMPTALFNRLIDELSEIGFAGEFHPHLYNEPLLDDRLSDLLQYVRKKLEGCKIALFTNGLLLTLDKYLELAACGVDSICVTRHQSADPPHIAAIFRHRENHGDDNVKLDYVQEGLDEEILFNRGGAIPLKEVYNITRRCTWPSYYLTINYKGDVLLCCNDYFGTFPIGNVMHHSIMEVWGKTCNKLLREHLSKDVSKINLCRKCMIGIVR
jgi:MoaA/NifB/PqqE/SkfB family radical SAM enzyme